MDRDISFRRFCLKVFDYRACIWKKKEKNLFYSAEFDETGDLKMDENVNGNHVWMCHVCWCMPCDGMDEA